MLAPYLLSCVPESVCLSQADVVSKRLDESSWFLAWRLPSIYPTLCCPKISVSPKIKNLSLWNFATNRGKSIALSTKLVVVVVDCRVCWWHVYDNRVVAVYYKSVNSNVILYFHYFDLLWICCTTCFYVWQDFNGRSASRAASAVACKANAVNLDSYTRLGVSGAWPGC